MSTTSTTTTTTTTSSASNGAAYNDSAATRLRETGTARASHLDGLRAVVAWPGLYELADEIDKMILDLGSRRGRRRSYPTYILLALVIATREYGSEAKVLTETRDPAIWAELNRSVQESPEAQERQLWVPTRAPSRDQLRQFIKRLTSLPGWHERLQQVFQRFAIGQAQVMGNLDPNTEVDWANPSLRNAIIGDGMVISRFSDVTECVDPITGEIVYFGSRGTTPRIAPRGTDLREDNKAHLNGLNMVHFLTATDHGWVILGTGYATGAEQWASLDLLDSIAAKTAGVHTLLWDRVYTGWLVDYTTGRHGIRVVNKLPAETTRRSTADIETLHGRQRQRRFADTHLARVMSPEHVERVLANHTADFSDEELAQASNKLIKHHLNQADLLRRYYANEPQPLGFSMYASASATSAKRRSSSNDIEVVRSEFVHFGTHEHQGANGTCSHELYVDDGALVSVEYDLDMECLVKTAVARCTSARRRTRAGGRWGSTDTWLMPCPNGDFEITYEWNPNWERYTVETPKDDREFADKIGNILRPINRQQAQDFADVANFRNHAESYNSWYQNTLPRYGRAARLSIDGQLLDYLAAACLRNALTWAAFEADTTYED